jgi:hypothetical protein
MATGDQTLLPETSQEARSPWGAESFALGAPAPTRRWGPILVGLGVLVALVAASIVYLFARGAEPALALRYREGQSFRYQLRMAIEGAISSEELGLDQPLVGEIDYVMSLQVAAVDADGVATIKVTMEDSTTTFNGQTQSVPGGFTAAIMVAPDGRVLASGGLGFAPTGPSSFSVPGLDQFTPLLPDGDAMPGDTWSEEFDIPMPFGDGTLHYEVDGTFLRHEDVSGVRTAVIQSHVRAPLDFTVELRRLAEQFGAAGDAFPAGSDPTIAYDGLMEFDMTSWFDPGAGQPVRNVMAGTIDMRMRFQGFPEADGLTQGTVRMIGDIDMEVTNLGA